MPLDTTWAIEQLDEYIDRAAPVQIPNPSGVAGTRRTKTTATQAEVIAAAQVAEQIIDRVLPNWRTDIPRDSRQSRWIPVTEAARRAKVELLRADEIREKLGDNAPILDAGRLHPWAWEGARSLWQSGHYREAVHAAAVKVNAETQNKIGRRDITETDLFKQALSDNPAAAGQPRLRLRGDDGGKTAGSVRRGARCFAEGCYAALRNPASHDEGELPEHEALEQLAAFSILARWVDTAAVEPG